MIHRAILGSIERMMGVLIEHTAGKWPFWLSPRQCVVIPVSDKLNAYAQQVYLQIKNGGYYVDLEVSEKTFQKKIRECQLAQYNYIIVVGEEEFKQNTVNVRTRDGVVHGTLIVDKLMEEFAAKIKQFQ